MKYFGVTMVTIPFTGEEGPSAQVLTFRGECDSRWMLKQVVKHIRTAFGTKVDKDWVKAMCTIHNFQHGARIVTDEDIEKFIEFMEEGADDCEVEDIADQAVQGEPSEDSEELPTMSD